MSAGTAAHDSIWTKGFFYPTIATTWTLLLNGDMRDPLVSQTHLLDTNPESFTENKNFVSSVSHITTCHGTTSVHSLVPVVSLEEIKMSIVLIVWGKFWRRKSTDYSCERISSK
jgi:hypothetical protein